MKKLIAAFILACVGLTTAMGAAPAAAQNVRSFVSGHGNDANNCGLTTPCRTFAHALTVTNAGGEIDVLDPAGYGPMTITKAVSIVNDGVGTVGVAVPAGGFGITINAGPNDAVSLRGLTIQGGGAGIVGIKFNSGKSLTVDNCVILGTTVEGIAFVPASDARLTVSRTRAVGNGGTGIAVGNSGAGNVTVVLDHVESSNNGSGIFLDGHGNAGTITATVSDSVAADNFGVGYEAFTGGGIAPTTLTLVRSVASGNALGLDANGAGATIRVSYSAVHGNADGGHTLNGGVIQSYGNNVIDGNDVNNGAPPGIALR